MLGHVPEEIMKMGLSTERDDPEVTWWQILIDAKVTMLPTADGGKSRAIWEGYSPNHKLPDGTFCMGRFAAIEGSKIEPGEAKQVEIKLLVIEQLRDRFKQGLVWGIQEGGRKVGVGEILAVVEATAMPQTPPPSGGAGTEAVTQSATEIDYSKVIWWNILAEAKVSLLPTEAGGRRHAVWENFSPNHKLHDGRSCSGTFTKIAGGKIEPGGAGHAEIKFLVIEQFREVFKEGMVWDIQEGGKKVGTGEILAVIEAAAVPRAPVAKR